MNWTLDRMEPELRERVEKRLREQSTVRTVRCKDVCTEAAEGKLNRNKYGARRVNADGYHFGSRKEYREYLILKARQGQGQISGLRVHVKFALFDPGENCRGELFQIYTCDYVYRENGKLVVADAKGEATRKRLEWSRTKKMMRACHGIEVLEL